MRITLLLFLWANVALWAQSDTSFIEYLPRDKTVQLHTTFQDVSVIAQKGNNQDVLFRINNWSTGFYAKWGVAELFVAVPLRAFDNRTLNAQKSFGTGFGLNFYPGKMHFNYNFKYVQGFENFGKVWEDKFETLANNNFFIFNRLNFHYLFNSDEFSLKSALRFNDRQKKSAGSWILGVPLTFHLAAVDETRYSELENFTQSAIGIMAGYGYTYVIDRWATSLIVKGGADLRHSSFRSMNQWTVIPTANVIASSVYNWDRNFIGLIYNTYPEFPSEKDLALRIVNWKLRVYAGKRFF